MKDNQIQKAKKKKKKRYKQQEAMQLTESIIKTHVVCCHSCGKMIITYQAWKYIQKTAKYKKCTQ